MHVCLSVFFLGASQGEGLFAGVFLLFDDGERGGGLGL